MILKKSTYVDIGIDFASQGNYDIDIENEIKKILILILKPKYWYWTTLVGSVTSW